MNGTLFVLILIRKVLVQSVFTVSLVLILESFVYLKHVCCYYIDRSSLLSSEPQAESESSRCITDDSFC